MTVWGDLLFLINFSMDFLCFYITCLLLHMRLPTARSAAASVLGGVYSVAALFFDLSAPLSAAADIFALVLMCLIVFCVRGTGLTRIIRAIFVYLLVSALLGGVMTALFSLFNGMRLFDGLSDGEEGLDVWIFMLLAVAASFLTVRGGRLFRSSSARRVYELGIFYGDGSVTLRALSDSGNSAVEPISGRSVVFASLSACEPILSEELCEAIRLGKITDGTLSEAFLGVRLIPGRGIGGTSLLPAIKPRRACLLIGGERREVDVYLALTAEEIGAGKYDAIISSELTE